MKIEAESTLDSEGCSSNFQGASAAKLEGMHIYTYFAQFQKVVILNIKNNLIGWLIFFFVYIENLAKFQRIIK